MPRKAMTALEFTLKAQQVHGTLYSYVFVEYKNSTTKIKIVCSQHGIFEQLPFNHLLGKGCNKCNNSFCAKQSNTKAFIEKANKVHNFRYDYSLVAYKRAKDKVEISCRLHGSFYQSADKHLAGQGCKLCTKTSILNGYSRTRFLESCIKNNNGLGVLYVIKCSNEDEEFYKIGITSTPVEHRFKTKILMPYSYEIVQKVTEPAENIYKLEKYLHKIYKDYKYKPSISFSGETECFRI